MILHVDKSCIINREETSPNVAAKCSNKDSVAPQKATAQMLRKGKIKRKWTLVHQ